MALLPKNGIRGIRGLYSAIKPACSRDHLFFKTAPHDGVIIITRNDKLLTLNVNDSYWSVQYNAGVGGHTEESLQKIVDWIEQE